MFYQYLRTPGREVMKQFSCSTQLCMEYVLLTNIKMQLIIGIATFISSINKTFESSLFIFISLVFMNSELIYTIAIKLSIFLYHPDF